MSRCHEKGKLGLLRQFALTHFGTRAIMTRRLRVWSLRTAAAVLSPSLSARGLPRILDGTCCGSFLRPSSRASVRCYGWLDSGIGFGEGLVAGQNFQLTALLCIRLLTQTESKNF